MATVFRKTNPNGEESPFWYASIKRADGTWIKKSTKETDKGKALEMALAWQQGERDAAGGTLTHQRTLEILNETLRRTGEAVIEVITARRWLNDWLRGKEKATKERTVAEYRTTINGFLEHLGDRADLSLEAIRSGDVLEWREMLSKKKKLHPGTINNRIKILRMPFEVAREQGLLRVNPASARMLQSLIVTEEQKMEKGTFTAEQTKKLLTVAGDQWGGVIRFAFYTGARLRDLTNLRWNNIDLTNGTMTLTPMKTDRKGKKLTLPLHPDLAQWLLERPTTDDGKAYLFPDLANRSSGGREGLSYDFQKLMKAAGIAAEYEYLEAEGDARKRIKLSFHSFRHAFSSMLANAGVPQEIRQKLTGHASAEVHALYTHHDMEVLREATAKLPGIS
jgi:integrase